MRGMANRACAPIVEHRPCFYAGHCAKVTVPFPASDYGPAIPQHSHGCPAPSAPGRPAAFFKDDAAASALRARLPHDVDEAQQRLSPGEEIVQDEHSVLRAEKFFG